MRRLKLHRRHAENCTAGNPPYSRSYESDELTRRLKKCYCPIYVSGTLGGKFRRQTTGATNWEDAKAAATNWEQAGRWEPSEEPAAPNATAAQERDLPRRYPIQYATEAYLANRQGKNIAESTVRKYRTLVKQLRAFADSNGYVMLDQLSEPADMDEFYSRWKDGVRAKGRKLERLKGFFEFCVTRKLITENPARHLEAPIGAGSPANRIPFTDAELTRIYEACDKLPDVHWKNHLGSGVWTGEDVKTIVMVLSWTGLRISDAATFDMSRVAPDLKGGANVFLRMHKTKGPVSTWIDGWLYERLLARERKYGSRIFRCGESERLETITDTWRRKINQVFDLAGPFECGTPTPHIFRHTFVRLLLQREVSPRDVAVLIGDTEDVVLKQYARWVPERQERLTNILREKLADAPKPKLVAIRRNRK